MHATIRVSLSWLNVVIVLQGSRLPHDPAPENSSPKKATLSRDAKIRAGKIRRLPEMRVNCTCTLKKERKKRKKRKRGRVGLLIKFIVEPLYSHRDANNKCR